MNVFQHIFLVFSAVTILIPTAFNLTHLLSHHEHEAGINYADEHFHSKSLECDLNKLQQSPALALNFWNFESKPFITAKTAYPNHYYFLSDYQKLSFELRGPPVS